MLGSSPNGGSHDRFPRSRRAPFATLRPPFLLVLQAWLQTACFRIVQEGVSNIVRHARATRISVRLERVVSDLVLLITDDGAGFDMRLVRTSSGMSTLGLRGMEERAHAVGGTITIDSAPALGTEICVRFPNKGEKRRDADFPKSVELAKV